jgi:hypothetical protein
MDRNSRSRASAVTVLWTPWGPVPDVGRAGGKIARMRPQAQAVRHKRVGFDVKPRDTHPSKQ